MTLRSVLRIRGPANANARHASDPKRSLSQVAKKAFHRFRRLARYRDAHRGRSARLSAHWRSRNCPVLRDVVDHRAWFDGRLPPAVHASRVLHQFGHERRFARHGIDGGAWADAVVGGDASPTPRALGSRGRSALPQLAWYNPSRTFARLV